MLLLHSHDLHTTESGIHFLPMFWIHKYTRSYTVCANAEGASPASITLQYIQNDAANVHCMQQWHDTIEIGINYSHASS